MKRGSKKAMSRGGKKSHSKIVEKLMMKRKKVVSFEEETIPVKKLQGAECCQSVGVHGFCHQLGIEEKPMFVEIVVPVPKNTYKKGEHKYLKKKKKCWSFGEWGVQFDESGDEKHLIVHVRSGLIMAQMNNFKDALWTAYRLNEDVETVWRVSERQVQELYDLKIEACDVINGLGLSYVHPKSNAEQTVERKNGLMRRRRK